MKSLLRSKIVFFLIIVAAGLFLRVYFLQSLPFTNDEGAYLYDARSILVGNHPGGDILTKAPVVIVIFSIFVWLTNGSLFAARLASVLFGLATLLPLTVIAGSVTRHVRLPMIIWLLFSAPVVLMSFGQTEAIAVYFAATALACVVLAFRKNNYSWAFWGGVSFVLALGARKINIALIVPFLILALQYSKNRRLRNKIIGYFGIGAIVSCLVIGVFIFKTFGVLGLVEFAGGGYARIVGSKLLGDSRVDIWGISFFDAFKILGRIATTHVVLLVMVIVGLAVKAGRCGLSKLYRLLFVVFWLFALAALYAVWPTFLPDYAADFLVPVTILGAWIFSAIWTRTSYSVRSLMVMCFIALNLVSYYSIVKRPWTGMFSINATRLMAETISASVPENEPILTAATIVPYVTGHRTLFNISHPLWYRYDFISDANKGLYLPEWENVATVFRQGGVRWILMEHLTDYAYFRTSDNLINDLGPNWGMTATIPNDTGFRSNTLKLYHRK